MTDLCVEAVDAALTPSGRGVRRVTEGLVKASCRADQFCGLPRGLTRFGLLRRLKDARRHWGLSLGDLDTLDLLISYTRDQDWSHGKRPLVFASNCTLERRLGVTSTALRKRMRRLEDRGLVAHKDSANGKRYGRRTENGDLALSQSYGIDLTPLAALAGTICEVSDDLARAAQARATQKARRSALRRDIDGLAHYANELDALETKDELIILRHGLLRQGHAKAGDEVERALDLIAFRLAEIRRRLSPEDRRPAYGEDFGLEGAPTNVRQEDSHTSTDADQYVLEGVQPQNSKPARPEAPMGQSTHRRSSTARPPRNLRPEQILRAMPGFMSEMLPKDRSPEPEEMLEIARMYALHFGIEAPVWADACRAAGRMAAVIVLSDMAWRVRIISDPNAYLTSQARRIAVGSFNWAAALRCRRPASASAGSSRQIATRRQPAPGNDSQTSIESDPKQHNSHLFLANFIIKSKIE